MKTSKSEINLLKTFVEPTKPIDIITSRSKIFTKFNMINSHNTNIDLNYSVYVDNPMIASSPDSNISKICPKQNEKWVDSNLIHKCQNCDNTFGFITRKHHCRACGGVYCYKCCNTYIVIPEKIIKKPVIDKSYKSLFTTSYRWLFNNNKQLVCNDCNIKILDLNEIEILLKIFYYLDLKTLYKISSVSKAYNKATKYYVAKFRDIQYKNINECNEIYDKWDMSILYNMKECVIFHSVWFHILIKTIYCNEILIIERLEWLSNIIRNMTFGSIDAIYNQSPKITCWSLLCSRKCVKILEIDDIINVLLYISTNFTLNEKIWENKHNREIILNLFVLLMRKCMHNLHIYIGLICKILKNFLSNETINLDREYIESILNIIIFKKVHVCETDLINISKDDILRVNLLLFESKYLENNGKTKNKLDMETCIFIKEVESYISKNFGSDIINLVNASIDFIKNLLIAPQTITCPIIYPLDPNYMILKINNRIVLNSNTKPIIIDAEITNKSNIGDTKNVKFIIKRDKNLRKEQIISCLIDVLQYKINSYKNENYLLTPNQDEINMPTYQILMITGDIGLIEYIEDSITLRLINENGYTLQNYILNHNSNLTLDMIKNRFVYSLSISSSISYIIGLGDRHLDNIMINKRGQIFHIDYGYIMENPITTFFEMPQIKVTNDIIDFLGGTQSKYYDNFKKMVIKIYNILRANKNVFNIYFKFICEEGYLNWNTIENKLNQKLMTGMKCKDIEITLINEIESANSFTNMFVDICHTYKQKMF
jgi:phosphatidylinositol 3-kinase